MKPWMTWLTGPWTPMIAEDVRTRDGSAPSQLDIEPQTVYAQGQAHATSRKATGLVLTFASRFPCDTATLEGRDFPD